MEGYNSRGHIGVGLVRDEIMHEVLDNLEVGFWKNRRETRILFVWA